MLLSLLLTLTPIKSDILRGFYGREAQAWLLGQVAQYDADLAEDLHRPNTRRPYTVSTLIVNDAGRRGPDGEIAIVRGNEVQLRITSLDTSLSELLLAKIVPNLPQHLRLKWTEFCELRLSEENGWDDQTTFEELIEDASAQKGESVTLEFSSPTAFRFEQVDQTLPTPELVWKSLYQRWNSFAPERLHLDPLWPDFARRCLVVSDFSLRSMKVAFQNGQKGAATGATGRATYRLLPEKHCGEFAAFRPGAANVLRTLAGFALYAGVGHHTTIGLGQTRWLRSSRSLQD
ncbi:MAG: CRISPR system precrRNA processing endoribonuclease RAMP protein Cas6 [Anaerolineales bacterium]|nr:CRISPR system precrRNA processing endoribonuclease RAMP protein Cas6 [Anaerolineales bacterium]